VIIYSAACTDHLGHELLTLMSIAKSVEHFRMLDFISRFLYLDAHLLISVGPMASVIYTLPSFVPASYLKRSSRHGRGCHPALFNLFSFARVVHNLSSRAWQQAISQTHPSYLGKRGVVDTLSAMWPDDNEIPAMSCFPSTRVRDSRSCIVVVYSISLAWGGKIERNELGVLLDNSLLL